MDAANHKGNRKAFGCLTVLLVLVALVSALAYVHHIRGARFQATATAIEALTLDECEAALDQLGHEFTFARDMCGGHESDLWFSVSVKNVGHRGAYLLDCLVEGVSAEGHLLYEGEVNVPPVGFPNAGTHLDPGETVEYRWYLNAKPVGLLGPVDHFTASCNPVVYDEGVPA
jgi:hypothetical protein